MSVARLAFRHPLLHANSAIADPSSCATFPNENASRPLAPKRFGPIWSVPMHGATARTPRLIVSCTTGAAKSTSHVVKMTSAPCESSFAAQARAIAGLLPCVLHVAMRSFRPLAPPRAFTCFTRIWAAARAGPSNGAMAPFPSYAHPITIGSFGAAGADAAVNATTAVTVARTAASAPVFLLVITPPGAWVWTPSTIPLSP